MPFPTRRTQGLGLVALGAFFVGAPSANAAMVQLNWWVEGELAGSYALTADDSANGMFNFAGTLQYLNPQNPFELISLDYNLNGKPFVYNGFFDGVLVSGNLAVENQFNSDVDITLEVVMPIFPSISQGSLIGGSVAVGLTTDSGGGDLSSLAGTPVWQATADGVAIGLEASLLFDPFLLHNEGLGSSSTDANFGFPDAIGGPSITDSIGIDINFNITSLDQASFTSVFSAVPIPAPGGLAVLGLAALGLRRRRRA